MKRFLSVLLSLCMLLSAVPTFAAEYAADDDTVFYISFDEELPEGSMENGVTYLEDGVYGKCGQFNGSFSYIKLPDNLTVGVTDFTLATWVMLEGTLAWQRMVDLGSGQSNNMFLALATDKNIRGTVKVNGGNEERLTGEGMAKINEWMHVAMVQEGTTRTLYVDGVAVESVEVTYTPDAMGNTGSNYIGKSQYDDPYFNGRLDEIVFSKKAMSADEIAKLATVEFTKEKLLAAIDIPGKENIKEHITLPTAIKGYPVKWASSNEDVVYPYDIPNGDYVIPAGKVTRQDTDTMVTLTASVDYNGEILTKDIDVNVVAAPAPVGETEAYLYVYFRGNVNGAAEDQQIYLAESADGYKWYDLNGNRPILESELGTQHLRDPYLLRSKEGDRFYLLATDLDTQDGQGWGPWSLSGSKYLMIWESDDLVNWSEQRMVKFANADMGCAWAPEAIWDPDTEEYLVYASGKDLTLGDAAIDTVYVVRTRDFRTFSEPEYFVQPYEDNGVTTYGEGTRRIAAIDSNIIQANDGKFYHFYKKWNSQVAMLVSDHASGPWEEVPGYSYKGGEGPGSFLVKGTDDTYALLIDNYSVYIPYLTTDIASGEFTKATDTIRMPTGSKHGGFLPVNAEEYARVMEKWGSPEPDAEGSEAAYTFDFESDVTEYLNGNAAVRYNEDRESTTLVLDGNQSYFEFPEGAFDKRDTFTLSFDVLNDNSASNHMTFSVGTGDQQYYFYKIESDTVMRSAMTISSWGYEEKAISGTLANLTDNWMHIDLVVDKDDMKIYKDGVLVAKNAVTKTLYHFAEEGLNAYLGKSMYSADPYFKGEFDNVELYYRALTVSELTGYTDEEIAAMDAEAIDIGVGEDMVAKNDLTLPTEGVYESVITWESSDESVISADGKVNIPGFGEPSKTVKLTATVASGDAEPVTKEYVLLVKSVSEEVKSTVADAWTTYDIPSAEGRVTYKFNITAEQLTDGVVAFTSSDTTPNGYASYSMLMRVTPSGYFDAYNINTYTKTNTIYYEAGKTYPITIVANVANKTYSVYVEVDGETKTIAENFGFRAQNAEIGKLTIMGGHGITAGLVTVTGFEVVFPAPISFENVTITGGKVTGSVVSEEELGESIVIVASYNDEGAIVSAKAVKLVDNAFEAEAKTENVRVMLWNSVSGMVPYLEAITAE